MFLLYSFENSEKVKVLVSQWCLCDPMDYTLPGSSVHGILHGLLCPSPGDLPDPRIKPGSSALQADSLLSESPGKPSENNNFALKKSCKKGNIIDKKIKYFL